MGLVTQAVKNLFGGVSQAPDAQRDASQFAEQENALGIIGRRLGRRPSKLHNATLLTGVDCTNAFIHTVTVSNGKKVHLVVVNSQVKAYDAETGAPFTMHTLYPSSVTYLAGSNFRAATQGDTTILVNRDVTVAKAADTAPAIVYEALVAVQQGDYETPYTIALDGNVLTYTTPAATAAGAKLAIATTAIASQLLSQASGLLATYTVQQFGSTLYFARVDGADFTISSYDGLAGKGLRVIKGSTQTAADLPETARDGVVIQVAGNPETDVDDYYVQFDDFGTPGKVGVWREVAKPGSLIRLDASTMPHQAVFKGAFTPELKARDATPRFTVGQNTAATQWTVRLPQRAIFPDGVTLSVYVGVEGPFSYTTAAGDTAEDVILALRAAINTSPNYVAAAVAPYWSTWGIAITRADSASFGNVFTQTSWDVSTQAWLDDDALQDDSLVGFVLHNLSDGSTGIITANTPNTVEVSGGLSGGTLNTIQAGNRLVVKAAGEYFAVTPCRWNDRAAGSDDVVPFPSFVGETLADAAFFEGRLAVTAGRTTVFSQAGNIFNWFRQTATQILSDDPIDIAQTGEGGAPFHAMLPWNDALYLFSAQDQVVLSGGRDVLTPDTVQLRAVSHYRNDPGCRPVQAGQRLFFVSQQFGFTRLFDYHLARYTDHHEALDVSVEVPAYVPGGIAQLAADEALGLVFLRSGDSTVYVYTYRDQEDSRAQSAWSKWTFASGSLRAIAIVSGVVMFLTAYDADSLVLEIMELTEESLSITHTSGFAVFDGSEEFDGTILFDGAGAVTTTVTRPSRVYLDRRVSSTSGSVSSSYSGGYTTWVLPYDVALDGSDGLPAVAVERTGEAPMVFRLGAANEVSVLGDYTGEVVQLGIRYTTTADLSTFYVRDRNGNADERGRLQLRWLRLHYADSTELTVTVTQPGRAPSTYTMALSDLGAGTFNVPLLGLNSDTTIQLSVSGPGAFFLTSYEWEGTYHARGVRL